jgi:hypothetical protein
MVAPSQRLRDPNTVIAWAQRQADAPAAIKRQTLGGNGPDVLQTSLAPQLNDERSARDSDLPKPRDDEYEQTVTSHRLDQTGGDIPRAASGFQAPNRESVTKSQKAGSCGNTFAGPFGLRGGTRSA